MQAPHVRRSTPTRSPLRRRLWCAVVGGGLLLGCLGVSPSPAGAAATDSDTLLWVPSQHSTYAMARNGTITPFDQIPAAASFEGDFSGAPGTDVFLYNPGSGPDGVLHLEPSGTAVTTSFVPKVVYGSYIPLVGDFDGNAIDDIFWYGPGGAADNLWLFSSSGAHTSRVESVGGTYQPTVIEATGDGIDDILWYAPGSTHDFIWRFGAGATHRARRVNINGTYELVPGYFGLQPEGSPQQRLIFYNPAGLDTIWTFEPSADHTSAPLPNVDGNHLPVVGRFTDPDLDAVLWYGPGSVPEAFWSFTDAGAVNQLEPLPVHGVYGSTAVGDFDGNGFQDIAWNTADVTNIWSFHDGGYTSSQMRYFTGVLRVGFTDPFDLG